MVTISAARLCADKGCRSPLGATWALAAFPADVELWRLVELTGRGGEEFSVVYTATDFRAQQLWSGDPARGKLTKDGWALVARPLRVRVAEAGALAVTVWSEGQRSPTLLSVVVTAKGAALM